MNTLNQPIVCKFGGTSLADAAQIRQVVAIVRSDPRRRYVVVSAPGRRSKSDDKVTDLLIRAHGETGDARLATFSLVAERFRDIVRELGVPIVIESYLDEIREAVRRGCTLPYLASRGEFLNGLVVASALGYHFLDAAHVVRFDADGSWNTLGARSETSQLLRGRLGALPHAVIPGFYGEDANGEIATFPRNGSDITGALVAAAVRAARYENWGDTPGVLAADPRVVESPRPIEAATFVAMRELAYGGASVLHEEAVLPALEAGVPINVRCTGSPEHPGTLVVRELPAEHRGRAQNPVVGIAARRGFLPFRLWKTGMNDKVGFLAGVCETFRDLGVSIEHVPSSIDTVTVVVDGAAVDGRVEDVVTTLHRRCRPSSVKVEEKLALVCVVGDAMSHTPGVAARIFAALARASVNVRLITQGSSETNVVVGVDEDDHDRAVRALYAEFFP